MKPAIPRLIAACLLGMIGNTSSQAALFQHVDSLATEVRERANDVCWEMYRNCRHQPAYRETYRDAKEMWSIAGHIHDLVHNSSSPTRVQRNSVELAECSPVFGSKCPNGASWTSTDTNMHARSD